MKGIEVGAIKVFFKMLPKVAMSLIYVLIIVEVGSEMLIIGSTFHK